MRRERPADVRFITGATGSGKSWYVRREIERHRQRIIAWDWKDDHPEIPAVQLHELARRTLNERALRYLPRYVDVDRQFSLFCRIAWAVQRADPHTDCLLVVEECSKVTRPGCAPEHWQNIVELGRVYGFTVMATTQRPAYVDLGFRGAATFVRCGRLGEEADARAIGARIGVDHREIQRLPDRAAYVFDGRKTKLEKARNTVSATSR